MSMILTQAELDAMPAKTKKHPAVVQCYLNHDFLTAYAMHTDMRVRENGPKAAVGSVDDWERHGLLQAAFLKQMELMPSHRLLEIGCGTGRLARKIVQYLNVGRYIGWDISPAAVRSARELAESEGWAKRHPVFSTAQVCRRDSVDYAWSFSVFIHLPAVLVTQTMTQVAERLAPDGQFLFSYVPEQMDLRTGLKQFRHTQRTIQRCCEMAGLSFEPVPQWAGEQKIARARRLA